MPASEGTHSLAPPHLTSPQLSLAILLSLFSCSLFPRARSPGYIGSALVGVGSGGHMQSEDNLGESILFLHHVNPGNKLRPSFLMPHQAKEVMVVQW